MFQKKLNSWPLANGTRFELTVKTDAVLDLPHVWKKGNTRWCRGGAMPGLAWVAFIKLGDASVPLVANDQTVLQPHRGCTFR